VPAGAGVIAVAVDRATTVGPLEPLAVLGPEPQAAPAAVRTTAPRIENQRPSDRGVGGLEFEWRLPVWIRIAEVRVRRVCGSFGGGVGRHRLLWEGRVCAGIAVAVDVALRVGGCT
jgi:hypothetical protein